jgi:hypothetical protein
MSEKKKDIIPEEVEKVQESPQTPVEEPSASPQSVNVLSQKDSQISDLVKEAPTDFVHLAGMKEVKLPNILELPEECKALHGKQYRFRWLAKDKFLEAKLRSSIWALCTRNNATFIKPHRFKLHGAVEQAGMLLAFAPEDIARVREAMPARKSAELVKHYTEDLAKSGTKDRGGFYQPETADTGDDNEEGLIEGRDF